MGGAPPVPPVPDTPPDPPVPPTPPPPDPPCEPSLTSPSAPEKPPSGGRGFAVSSGDPVAQEASQPATEANIKTVQQWRAQKGDARIKADLLLRAVFIRLRTNDTVGQIRLAQTTTHPRHYHRSNVLYPSENTGHRRSWGFDSAACWLPASKALREHRRNTDDLRFSKTTTLLHGVWCIDRPTGRAMPLVRRHP